MNIGSNQITKGTIIIIGAIAIIFLLLGLVVFGVLPGSRPTPPQQTTLEFWGLFDSVAVWQSFFDAYEKEGSNTSFRYTQKNPDTYEQDLIEALAAGNAPDIIMFNSLWLPKHGNKISPLPETLMTLKTFQETFPDVATVDFVSQGEIYAIPVWTDVLVIYYNKDLFNAAKIATPPKTWDDFIKVAQKLSAKDAAGNLTKSGAALGAADNIANAADILSLLMLQAGTKMIADGGVAAAFDNPVTVGDSTYKPGESALRFYTDFANPKSAAYSWNNAFPNSVDAFASGKTAIIFGYAADMPIIKQRAPNLKLGIAPIPQLADSGKIVNYSDFWGYSVPVMSQNSDAAWKFLTFLTNQDINRYFSEAISRPASRRDILSEQQNSADLGVFAESILSAVNWYQADPAAVSAIFKDMVNSVVLNNVAPADALSDAAARVTALMRGRQ